MTVPFNSVPTNLRLPFVAVEFDNTRAQQGPALLPYRALLIGQKTSSGTATANTILRVTNADQVLTYAGRGSMLHRQATAWFLNNKFTETYIGVLSDHGSAVQATSTITIAGTATAAGTLNVYIGGQYVPVAVASGTGFAAVATALNAAIAAQPDLPVTSTVSAGAVTPVAKNLGACGNDIDIRVNYQDGQRTPAGLTVTIVAMNSGATNPTLTTLITAMGDTWYHVISHPYNDATSLTALEAELLSRFGPMRMIDGVMITSGNGSQSTLSTLGDTRNSPHSSIVGQPGTIPITPPMEFAAAVAAVVAYYANQDPARPLQTLPILGVLPPAESNYFTNTERNLMLYDGVSTSKVGPGGVVQIERLVTTYQTNAAGAGDTSYLDLTTMLTILYLRYSFRNRLLSRYPRHKLAADGGRYGAGQAVITPKIGKAEAVLWFREMEELGLVENFDQFKTDLVVERNISNPNRLDFLLPPDIMNQFVTGAVNLQFRL